MAILKKCNFCGKTENQKGVVFGDSILKLIVPAYDGKNYNVYLMVDCVYDKDEQRIEQTRKELANPKPEDILKMLACGGAKTIKEEGGKDSILVNKKITLEEPYPLMCEKCKKGIAYLLLQCGMAHQMEKF